MKTTAFGTGLVLLALLAAPACVVYEPVPVYQPGPSTYERA